MNILRDKVAVITGGTRGLGLAIAQAFMAEGAAVVLGSRSEESVQFATNWLKRQGGNAAGLACDVTKLEKVDDLANFAIDQFGHFDIWINNAGIGCPIGPTMYIDPECIRDAIETNILGVYNGSRAAMRYFLTQGSGKLINLSGRGEKSPTPMFNPYGSSKAWVRTFTLALAKEHQNSGVGIYLFQPGLVKSDMMAHMFFIDGYVERNMRIFRIISPIFAQEPKLAAKKAVWLASPATDGKTGLHVSLLGPLQAIGGLVRQLFRMISHRNVTPPDVKISVVAPASDFPTPPVPMEANAGTVPVDYKPKSSDTQNRQYIYPLLSPAIPNSIGNKAANLRLLHHKKFQIPETFVCSWEAHQEYLANREEILDRLAQELRNLLKPNQSYAVRSSANIEDSLEYSFAGQFTTVLNLQNIDQILQAICQIWDEVQSDSVKVYLQRAFNSQITLKMAVVIQEMITPCYSGVSFSKNPITTLDEVIVEAILGIGTPLVQDGITPMRWVNKWGNWIVLPDGNPIPIEIMEQVVSQTKKIAKIFDKEVDLEWVYDGKHLYWLQMRDITSIRNVTFYSNRMAKEMTPGLVKPLVWSVTIPNPSAAWTSLLSEITGKNDIDPNQLMRAFHYQAYHNMAAFGQIFESLGLPRESLEMMLGILPPGSGKPPMKMSLQTLLLMPRIIRFVYDKLTFSKKLDRNYPLFLSSAQSFALHPEPDIPEQQLLNKIDKISELNRDLVYFTIVTILLMQIYNALLRRQLKKQGIDFQHFNLLEGLDEINDFDPPYHLQLLHQKYMNLDEKGRRAVETGDLETLCSLPNAEFFCEQFQEFMLRFGHLSDTTGHFGSIPWRDTPDFILKLIAEYQSPGEVNEQVNYKDLNDNRYLLRLFYNRARQFRLYREKYSSLYSYTLMLFREYYLGIGGHFSRSGLIQTSSDILYLYDNEVRSYISGQANGKDFEKLVEQRKLEMEHARNAILPEVIFGESIPVLMLSTNNKLKGTATSKGYYTGPARIIRSVIDFPNVQIGDVIVIPYSDVSWTPLFAKAGAVISESGGILSHSSIIAREYNIPAVVSVPGALQIEEGTTIMVDGYKGEVIVSANMSVDLNAIEFDNSA